MNILEYIIQAKKENKKLLAILIDPDKISDIGKIISEFRAATPDFIFVGGSKVEKEKFDFVIETLHQAKICPVIIFPGSYEQINEESDAILLLSLISGRNPEYLIDQHIKAAQTLNQYKGEVLSTSYVLIDGGKKTSVQEVSQTKPIPQGNIKRICDTIIAGKLIGHQLHYLEAGSGANKHVSSQIIEQVRTVTDQPIIVGGGIRDAQTAMMLYECGADIIVVGNGFEDRNELLKELIQTIK